MVDATKLNKKIIEEILNALDGAVWGMTIEEISDATGRHRNTLAKYLPLLESLGLVVRRSIGKYTFWLLSTTYNYRSSDVPRRFFQLLAKFFDEECKKYNPSLIFEISRKIGYALINREEFYKSVKKSIKLRDLYQSFGGIFGIFLPTMLPKIRFRIGEINQEDDSIRISVAKCPCDGKPEYKSSCDAIGGFIQGVMEKIGLDVVQLKEVECQIEGAPFCTFEAKLKKKVKHYFPIFAESNK